MTLADLAFQLAGVFLVQFGVWQLPLEQSWRSALSIIMAGVCALWMFRGMP